MIQLNSQKNNRNVNVSSFTVIKFEAATKSIIILTSMIEPRFFTMEDLVLIKAYEFD